ncbi:RloB family protein [candidate division KSB1 bacterium]
MSLTFRKKRPLIRTIPHVRDTRLIIIAAENTYIEKQYFSIFKHHLVQVRVLFTETGASSPRYVLERLKKYKNDYDLKSDDQLWLMVDRDNWTERELDKVTQECVQKGFRLAISNPCFELWLYIHFEDIDYSKSYECIDIEKMLKEKLGSFNKTRLKVDRYHGKIKDAVRRAKAIDINPKDRWPNTTGTHVYKVVEEIISLIKKIP